MKKTISFSILGLILSLLLMSFDSSKTEILPYYFENNKWGFVDENFNTIIQPIYDDVSIFENGKSVVKNGAYCGLINTNNELLIPINYDIITIFNEDLAVAMKDNLSYIFHSKNNLIEKINYETIGIWNNKIIIMADSNQKVVLYNISNSNIIKTDYDDIVCPKATFNFGDKDYNYTARTLYNNSNINKDIALIVRKNKVGYIKDDCTILIEPKFDFGMIFQNDIGIVKLKKTWGIINTNGDYIVKPKYESINTEVRDDWNYKQLSGMSSRNELFGRNYINHGFIRVKRNKKWGIIDKKGIEIIKPKFYNGCSFFGNYGFTYGMTSDTEFTKVIDKIGNFKFKIDKGIYLNDSLFWFSNKNKFGIMSYTGKKLWEMDGEFKTSILNAMIAKINECYYIINTDGTFIEKTKFEKYIFPIIEHNDFYHFSFLNNDSLVCYDAYGKRLFKLNGNYSLTYFPSKDGELRLYKDDKIGLINKKGEILVQPEFEEISKISENFYLALPIQYSNAKYEFGEATGYIIQAKTNKRSKVLEKIPGKSFIFLEGYLKNSHLIH